MSRPGRLELAEYEMQKACKQNRKIPHPFVQFRQRRQALLHSIYQWVYARARLVGRTAGGQTGRPAGRQKLEVRREVLEPLTIYTQEGKRRRKERKKYSRRGMLFTSPPSPLTPNFRGVWHLSSTQSFAAQPAKSLRCASPHAPSATQRLAPPRAPPALYYSTELRTSEFPHRPQSKKKTFTTSTSYSLLACSWKSPGVFLQGDKKKKSRRRLALLYPLIQPRKARLNPSLIRRWDVKLKFGRGQMEQQQSTTTAA